MILALWELIKFCLLSYTLAFAFLGLLNPPPEKLLLLFCLGSGSLLIPAGSLYLFFSRQSFPSMTILFIVGKTTFLIPCLFSLFFSTFNFVSYLKGGNINYALSLEIFSLFIIFIFDLIFLLCLLSLKIEAKLIPTVETAEIKIPNSKD